MNAMRGRARAVVAALATLVLAGQLAARPGLQPPGRPDEHPGHRLAADRGRARSLRGHLHAKRLPVDELSALLTPGVLSAVTE